MSVRPRPAIDRFVSHLRQDGDCWVWTAAVVSRYGAFKPGFGDRRMVKAHRWSYEFHVGPIPDGLHLDHLCRNTLCVNPWHLEPVTCQENLLRSPDTWAGRNARKTHCPKRHPLPPFVPGGGRTCQVCKRERDRVNQRRRRERMSEPQQPQPDDGHADTVDESDYADPDEFPDAEESE